jgi:hypothetical protein
MFRYSSNANSFASQFAKIAAYAREEAGEYERQFVIELNKRILALTPVWEGDSIANYVWSVGSPLLTHISPIGGVAPGPTNTMALGTEPRRAENEAMVRERLASVLAAQLPANIYMTNSAPEIVNLEYRQNPTPDRTRVRSGGMVRLAIIQTIGTLHGR